MKILLSSVFVYDENLPSYDFLKIEKTPKFFYLPNTIIRESDKNIGVFRVGNTDYMTQNDCVR